MIKLISIYWELTQAVKETVNSKDVDKLMKKYFSKDFDYNIYETSKDEVLQIYNDEYCYTIIGGSSGDKWEWKSNFNFLPLKNKLIHNGFYKMAMEVVGHSCYVDRATKIFVGHSRGGAGASILAYLYNCKGVGFGVPKAFKKKVKVDFYNVRNSLDPVVKVVPFFRTCGDVLKLIFCKHPHTQYGKRIRKGDTID